MSGDGLEDLWLYDKRGHIAFKQGSLSHNDKKLYLKIHGDIKMSRLNDITLAEWDRSFRDWLGKPKNTTVPTSKQIGGKHYKGCKIQPIEYIQANKLSYEQGNVVKYITRYKEKGGVEDLRKAIHYIELIIGGMKDGDN